MTQSKKKYCLAELAERTGSLLIGDPHHIVYGVADLEMATPLDVSFLAISQYIASKYIQAMKESKAGLICIDKNMQRPEGKNYLLSDNPSECFQTIVELFYPPRMFPSGFQGIHPTSIVHASASLGVEVTLGPYVVIDEEAVIGDHTFIGAGTAIGPGTIVGKHCIIHTNVTIRENCIIGNRVVIQPGSVIGSCGFGYLTNSKGEHKKLNQVGNVVIQDDVEIGANATIDRARFKSTVVGKGTKIDNLVQLGHGVEVGAHNIIVAQVGIAGSTTTGNYVVLGGQVAVAGHLHLSDHVQVAGKSGVSKSLAAGKYGGIPAISLVEYNKNTVYLRNIEIYIKQIKELQKQVKELQGVIEKS